MKAVVVDWDITYPMNSGKRLRTLNLMLALAERHQITYLSRGVESSSEAQAAREFLGDHGIQSVFLSSPVPGKVGLGYYGRIAKNLASRNPYAVDVHQSRDFVRQYRQFARENQFDVWQVEWTPYATMLDGIANVSRLIVAHNVDSLIWKRYYETETRPLHRLYIKNQYQRFRKFESRAFASAERVVSVSPPDAELMREMFGIDCVDVVDNGVDLEKYGTIKRQSDPNEVLFLGSLDWRPNQDAIRVLLDQVFPKLIKRRPQAKLTIVGRNAPVWMTTQVDRLGPSVQLHADVPDVFPYLARAGMMAVPLRIGGGSRLKIIEALAARVPVVASAVAAEGLTLRSDQDFALADDADAMVDRIENWIDDPQSAQASAQFGFESVNQHYGWDRLGCLLEQSWMRCAGIKPDSGSNASTGDRGLADDRAAVESFS